MYYILRIKIQKFVCFLLLLTCINSLSGVVKCCGIKNYLAELIYVKSFDRTIVSLKQ